MSIHRKSLFGILILLVVVGIVIAQGGGMPAGMPPMGGGLGGPRNRPQENYQSNVVPNSIIEGTIRLHLENHETKEIDMLLIETPARKLGNISSGSGGVYKGYGPKEPGRVYEKWTIVKLPEGHPYLQFSDGKNIRIEGIIKNGLEWYTVKGQKITRDLYVLEGSSHDDIRNNLSRSSLELQVQQLQEEVSILNEEVYYLKKEMDMIRRKLATFR